MEQNSCLLQRKISLSLFLSRLVVAWTFQESALRYVTSRMSLTSRSFIWHGERRKIVGVDGKISEDQERNVYFMSLVSWAS